MSEHREFPSWKLVLSLAAMAAAILAVYLPVLRLQLTGDDYQMAQFAHETMCNPRLLLAPLGQFFRPLTNWSFMIDRALWGTNPAGYHATTLLLQVLAAAALLAASLRLGFSLLVATVIAVLWACSPFGDENAVWAAIRHQNYLLILWMLLVAIWPWAGREERWSVPRLAAAGALLVALVLSKESWVVTPALVFIVAAACAGWEWRRALKPALLMAVPAVLYVGLRFVLIPTTGGYFEVSWAPLVKVPHMLAAFLWLEELAPVAFSLKLTGVLAIVAVAVLIVVAWRERAPAAVVGAAFLFIPMLPTLLVPFLPQRYTAIPYAGFLLLVCGVGRLIMARLPAGLTKIAVPATVLVALLLGSAGVAVVRADLVDWHRVSDAHARLLAQARAVAGGLTVGEPVAVVRMEREEPLKEISVSPRGLYKLFYTRRVQDPSGLIDAGALFDWVLNRPDVIVRRLELDELAAGRPGGVLVHRSTGFQWLREDVSDLSALARGWRRQGLQVRIVEAGWCRRSVPEGPLRERARLSRW
jgi:hypothetical protein